MKVDMMAPLERLGHPLSAESVINQAGSCSPARAALEHETTGSFPSKRVPPPFNHPSYGNLILVFDGYRFARNVA
jgi:hypothetical protein